MASFRWTCACCCQEFDTLPTCWRVGPPAPYQALSEDERTSRAVINDDCCFVDGQFYIRGEIKIPIIDTGESFIWNVWASLAEDSADEMMRTWDNQDRDQVGPFIGWLSSNLP